MQAKNYEKKKKIHLPATDKGLGNFVDTFSSPATSNNDQIIMTFNFIRAHSFLLKKIYPEWLKIV